MWSVVVARLLLVLLVVAAALLAARRLLGTSQTAAGTGDSYRPQGRAHKRARSRRDPPPANARSVVRRSALGEMRDALTGGPLDPEAELFRCAECQSFYSVASVRGLAMDNGARCINCGSIHRIAVEVVE